MSLRFVTVDVFTSTPYGGNPLSIIHVPISQSLSQTQKQLIAREFNLSECVFLHEQTDDEKEEGDVRIGIFTAIAEVPFAGHPTVGTSNYLLRMLKDSPSFQGVTALQTRAGRIPIRLSEDGNGVSLEVAHDLHTHQDAFKGRSFGHYPVVSIVKGMSFILAQLSNLEELSQQTENLIGAGSTYTSQDALHEGWREGLVATYYYVDLGSDVSGTTYIQARMFGSREDPATGSAASALCSYLTFTREGRPTREFRVTQGVEMGRKSDINIRVTRNPSGQGIKDIILSGTAVKVMEGTLSIPLED